MVFLLLGLMLLLIDTAGADNGPHVGDFPKTADACAGCHRAHRGKAENLLKESSQQALCFSCHGTGATGAYTNVQDGVYATGGTEGTPGDGLRGGGFENALMDPGMTGAPASASVTSKHNVEATGLTMWGNGDISSDPDPGKTNVSLKCASCHNPHGFSGADYYRVLRPRPLQSGATSDVNVPDESPKYYTITYYASGDRAGYRNVDYLTEVISQWCAQCHTRYLASSASDSGDAIFKYRHVTSDGYRKCLACHVAHGTSATMGTYSGAVEWPDDTAGGGASDSRLLHVNNRGVCIQCHPSP